MAYSTEVQNVITIHDQGNGISILNVWGVCARIGYSGHKSYHSDLNPLMRGQNVQGNGI